LFSRMNLEQEKVVETENPVSMEHSVARNWLLPSIMVVLEKNKNREYPQKIFEIGGCIDAKGAGSRKLAGAIADSKTNFSEIKSFAMGILNELGAKAKIKKFEHGSFIPGRCASFDYGFFGELNPEVLSAFSLEVPVTAFEINLGKIMGQKSD
jgi:phenylalanyl-tRNA synthetase beta chain